MKILFLIAIPVFAALGAHSQEVPVADVKDVIVVGSSWRFEVRNPMMDQDPMREAKLQEERGLAQVASVNNENPHRPAILKDPVSGKSPKGNSSGGYVYEIKVKNIGTKPILGLELDYVFADRDTKQEVDRLKLSSSNRIDAGKTRTLTFRSIAPPTGAIDAQKLGSGNKNLYLESIVINNVRYAKK